MSISLVRAATEGEWKKCKEYCRQRYPVKAQQGEVSCKELAWMASSVYDLHTTPHIGGTDDRDQNRYLQLLKDHGWHVAEGHQQPHFGDSILNARDPPVAMAVYKKGNIAVIAFKGTSGEGDLMMDVGCVFNGVSPVPSYKIACALAHKYQSQGCIVMVTGHSLGGYVAEVVATNLGLSGIGFAAPGSGWHGGRPTKGFHNINFEHDKLGNILCGIYQHPQWSIYIQDYSSQDGGWAGGTHKMQWMIPSMEKRGDWTNMNCQGKCSGWPTGYYNKKRL